MPQFPWPKSGQSVSWAFYSLAVPSRCFHEAQAGHRLHLGILLEFPFAPLRVKVSVPNETEVFKHDHSQVRRPAAEPPRVRIIAELASLRVSVNKLTRGNEVLASNVKALNQQVKVLSDLVHHMSKMMRPTAPEEEARNQLH
jgi:hypothetical protein